jgi:hypothetical protein
MALTGFPSGDPLTSPAASLSMLQKVLDELATVTRAAGRGAGRELCGDPAGLIVGRAALMGFTRHGQVSAGGSTRLFPTIDGWCAVTLSRDADIAAIPALLGVLGLHAEDADLDVDEWASLARAGQSRPAAEIADAAQLLGIPAGSLPPSPLPSPSTLWPPWTTSRIAARTPSSLPLAGSVVADLSSMWAGPLCARLLGLAGARVIKVESPDRPDGARAGSQAFYDWLHAGHESVALDFRTADGRERLGALLGAADVVIEASRPRALATLGVAPEMIPHKPGQVWLSITGYGRLAGGGVADRVAFGDDAAVAGGLVGWSTLRDVSAETPVFCADAIADPLTGVTGALAVARSLASGGGELIDLPMRAVAASFAAAAVPDHGEHEVRRDGTVYCVTMGRDQAVLPPRAPGAPAARAAALGADSDEVLAWLHRSRVR